MQPPNVEPPDEIPVIRPELSRQGERSSPGVARPGVGTRTTTRRLAVLAALAFAVVAALGVVFVLPDVVEPPADTAEAPPVAERDPARSAARVPASPREPGASAPPAPARAAGGPAEPDGADAERVAREKREAETGLAAVLRAKAALEASEVEVWAPDAWPAALAGLDGADATFRAARFVEALAEYRAVLEVFAAIDASRALRLERALADGAAALEVGDGEAAQRAFRIALALEPGNEVAALGARRARTIEQVLALMVEGEAREAADDLQTARERYMAAIDLDEHFGAAREALARVEAEIVARAFAEAMSAALGALDRGDLGGSTKALDTAEALVPGAPEVRDARARIVAVRQLRRIEARRREAQAHAASERWPEAAVAYGAALGIDPNLAFAIAGRAQALALARLHTEIDALNARPERLSDAGPLGKARAIIEDARALPERGPELAGKLERLEALVAVAGQPVSVLLLSDGATEITVYRVGRLGAFDSRQLQLRPGRYVAVGTRPGYRDVRVEFEIAPGRAAAPVLVRCEEPV